MDEAGSKPFFCDVEPALRERREFLDVYTSPHTGDGRKPAVLFVHGGPVPQDQQPRPQDWDGFVGYASLGAESGLVGITFNHRLHNAETDYPIAADDVAEAVEQARALDCVDPDRIALWFFSGGGALAADWLRKRPDWLRCLAWTYPALIPPPDWPGDHARFNAVTAASEAAALPQLLVRAGRDYEYFAQNQDELVSAARAHHGNLDIIEIPEAEHGFEGHGYVEESREAVNRAMLWVADALGS